LIANILKKMSLIQESTRLFSSKLWVSHAFIATMQANCFYRNYASKLLIRLLSKKAE